MIDLANLLIKYKINTNIIICRECTCELKAKNELELKTSFNIYKEMMISDQ